jgi:hypothetical protein
MKALFILIWFLSAAICAFGLPEDPVEYAAWEARMLKAIGDQSNADPVEAIPRLGLWMVQLSPPSRHREIDGRRVFNAALSALKEIPWHADYYKMRVIDARTAFDEEENPRARGALRSKLQNEQSNAFKVLALLPSPETVRVLGDFLGDERDRQSSDRSGEAWAGAPRNASNAQYALGSLAKLPLVSKPVPQRSGARVVFDDDIEAWRLWYEQVKLGKRTFRFEGDSREYNLDGPVPVQAVATRPQKTGPFKGEENSLGDEEKRGVPWGGVGTAFGLLLLAGFACLRSRRRKGQG